MIKCVFCNSELEDHSKDRCYSQRIHLWNIATVSAMKAKRFINEFRQIRDEHPRLMKAFETGVWED